MPTFKIVGPTVSSLHPTGIELIKEIRTNSGLDLRASKAIVDYMKSGDASMFVRESDSYDPVFTALREMFVGANVKGNTVYINTVHGPVKVTRNPKEEKKVKEQKIAICVDSEEPVSVAKTLKEMLQEALLVATNEECFTVAECILNAIKYIR